MKQGSAIYTCSHFPLWNEKDIGFKRKTGKTASTNNETEKEIAWIMEAKKVSKGNKPESKQAWGTKKLLT